MKRLIIFAGLCSLVLNSCQKEDTEFNTDLALDSRFIILNAPADTTRIVVYSDHNWTMESRENAPWLFIQKGSGNGTAYAIVSVTENTSDYPRAATLFFKAGNKSDTLKLAQRGMITPTLAIKATSLTAPAAEGNVQTEINTTLPLEMIHLEYSYGAGSNWISGLGIAEGLLSFNVASNESTEARSAKIYLSYQDLLGTNLRDSLTVNQSAP